MIPYVGQTVGPMIANKSVQVFYVSKRDEQHLDFFKVLEKETNKNIEKHLDIFKDVSIATEAMVTSYARIHINKIKLDILDKGGNIYYSDTDSIVLNKNSINKT